MEKREELYNYGLRIKNLSQKDIHPLVDAKFKTYINQAIEQNPNADLSSLKMSVQIALSHLLRNPTMDIPTVTFE